MKNALEKLLAYAKGMYEFRSDMTTGYDYPLIETYDKGRNRAHALTLRFFDPE